MYWCENCQKSVMTIDYITPQGEVKRVCPICHRVLSTDKINWGNLGRMLLSDEDKDKVLNLVKSKKFIFQGRVIPDYEDAISMATICKIAKLMIKSELPIHYKELGKPAVILTPPVECWQVMEDIMKSFQEIV